MSDDCTVRPVSKEDLPLILSWRNAPAVRAVMFSRHEISLEEHQQWFARASQDPTRRLLMAYTPQELIGYIQLTNVAPGGIADWGFYAAPNAPRGTGRKLGSAALTYAFEKEKLHKLCGQALASNTASRHLHVALGFSQEGVLRDQYLHDDNYLDVICFGLLAREWVRPTRGE